MYLSVFLIPQTHNLPTSVNFSETIIRNLISVLRSVVKTRRNLWLYAAFDSVCRFPGYFQLRFRTLASASLLPCACSRPGEEWRPLYDQKGQPLYGVKMRVSWLALGCLHAVQLAVSRKDPPLPSRAKERCGRRPDRRRQLMFSHALEGNYGWLILAADRFAAMKSDGNWVMA